MSGFRYDSPIKYFANACGTADVKQGMNIRFDSYDGTLLVNYSPVSGWMLDYFFRSFVKKPSASFNMSFALFSSAFSFSV